MDNERQLQAEQNKTQHGNSSIINELSLFSSPSAAWSLSKHTGTITTQSPVLVTSDQAIANHILSEKVLTNSSNQFAPVATENARDLTKKSENKVKKTSEVNAVN